jgi:stress response protein YsnF
MATNDRPVVVGVFENWAEAERAVRELQRAGFRNEQIKYSVNKGGPGILDGLVGMGLPYDEASFYNNEFQIGHTVVAVMAPERQQEAYEILRLSGAYTADSRQGRMSSFEQPHMMQLREEVLHVQKEWIRREEIRVHIRVITEEKVFKVPVRREEVTIERVPLKGQSTRQAQIDRTDMQEPTQVDSGEGRMIELKDGETFKVQVREERVFIETKPMVVEEIVLTKRMLEEMKEITETVQHEDLRIEHKGNVHIQGDTLDDAVIHSYQEE